MTLDPFAKGEVLGLARAGTPSRDNAASVLKSDGTHPSQRAVQQVIAAEEDIRRRDGERAPGTGRGRALTDKQRAAIVALVFKERGSATVTAAFCRQRLPFLRTVSPWTIRNALHDAGLRWLRRRQKRLVPKPHRAMRMTYARWVRKQHSKVLNNFAYVDGTTFYLARSDSELIDKGRRRLGPYVWKMSSGKDGLFSDTVGPSLYSRGQGTPVKVWGFLALGHLCYHVLPADDSGGTVHMNGWRYRAMVARYGTAWIRRCFKRMPRRVTLIQDYERCLWQRDSLSTLAQHHLFPLKKFPKCSPDLNAIEQVWHLLRQMLDASAPEIIESRSEFLIRFRKAVRALNTKCRAQLLAMCSDQQDRAREVLRLHGARTAW